MKVYKYRSNGDEEILKRDIETFSQNKFFAATFNDLNDPFEANFIDTITESARMLEKTFKISAKDIKNSFNEILEYKDKLGIISLSETALSEQMWAYYGNSNKGYCIEYDFDKISERTQNYDLFKDLNVKYTDVLPFITLDDIRSKEMPLKMFGTKKELWRHEKEIRLVFDSSSLKEYHESAITGIYFGYLANDELIEKFRENFQNKDITFYKISPNRGSNLLEYKTLYTLNRKLKYNLAKFQYELVYTKNNAVISYYIYVKENYTKSELRELGMALIEKISYKPTNIYFLNSKDTIIIELIDKYPKSDEELVLWANSVIAEFPFDCNDEIYLDPFKDWRYKELTE
ncbi:DUF2971 domain-containing protein [Elizabethkingia anophelis]|uniref:DUF2971 domain-containing protein n=1 Tax=Elizabethkingia anophelis TaxID=1117645 RepID=UPI001624148C|nr:DUF2971 domain-containing protein [Elizabethkingia anophelis]ELB0069612.1 DUF2971 domain-containing protein [Elizabethkingia anophelis]ELB1894439.1 DUF2971 domain-containing protein [Elizabethkingia anophelis]MDV2443933.1 hypothetical protein [Elizabethkingia anophelis]